MKEDQVINYKNKITAILQSKQGVTLGFRVNLKNLEAFYWVVTLNSFNKAATKLQTTQPAVSQKITALEKDLGFKILDRNFRQLKPTLFEYNEIYYNRIRRHSVNGWLSPEAFEQKYFKNLPGPAVHNTA